MKFNRMGETLVILLLLSSCIHSQPIEHFNHDQDMYQFESSFEPLAESEVLAWDRAGATLTIFAKNILNNSQRFIGRYRFATRAPYFTTDRKTAFFFLNSREFDDPFFKVDGEEGQVQYIGNITQNSVVDLNGEYILYFDRDSSDYINEQAYVEATLVFQLYSLVEQKNITSIEWDLLSAIGANPRIHRMQEPTNILLEFAAESIVRAEAILDLETLELTTTFDSTAGFEIDGKRSITESMIRDWIVLKEEFLGEY